MLACEQRQFNKLIDDKYSLKQDKYVLSCIVRNLNKFIEELVEKYIKDENEKREMYKELAKKAIANIPVMEAEDNLA